jgi:tyrosinase
MKVASILATAILAAVSTASALPRDDTNGLTESPELAQLLEDAKSQVMEQVTEQAEKLRKRGQTPTCTASKLVFRRE